MTEDEMAGWHHPLDGHKSEQTLGVGDGQGSLMCCSPWGHKELDKTEQLSTAQQKAVHILKSSEFANDFCSMSTFFFFSSFHFLSLFLTLKL